MCVCVYICMYVYVYMYIYMCAHLYMSLGSPSLDGSFGREVCFHVCINIYI